MRSGSRFLSHMLRSALMLTAAMSLAESAHAAIALQPDSNWAVSKIAATRTAGGGSYCALARRYSNGTVLTIARNQGDESSMAIDFQKNGALDKDMSYTVVLKPGGTEQRSFTVRPVSGRALVVRLGKDYAFNDALNREGVLGVQVGSNDYSFSMADFDDGQQKINGCLASLVEPAAGDASPKSVKVADNGASDTGEAATLPTSTADTLEVKASQGEVDTQNRSLEEENAKLKAALAKERKSIENSQANTSLTAELNDKIDLLQRENSDLRHQVSASKPSNPDEVKALKAQNQELSQELARLQATAAASQVNSEKSADADKKLADANAKVQEADQKLALADKELSQANEKNAQNANTGAAAETSADKKLAEANAKLEAANQKVAEADQKLSQADQKLMDASQKASQVNTELASSNDQQSAADQKLADATAKLNEANQKLADADQRLADAKAQVAAASQKSVTNGQVQSDAEAKLAQANARLNDATAKLNEANQKLADAETRAADAQQRNMTDGQAKSAAAQMLADAKLKLQQADAKMAEADKKLELASQQSAQGSQAAMGVQSRLDQANAKLADVQKALDAQTQRGALSEQKLAALSQKLQQEDQKLQSAQHQVAQAVSAPVLVPNASGDTADQKLAMVQQKLAEAEQREHDADAKSADADQKLAEAQKLAQKVASTKPVRDPQSAEIIASLQTQLQSAEKENADLRNQLKTAQTMAATQVSAPVGGVPIAQLRAVEDQLNAVTDERDHLKQQIDAYHQGGEDHLLKISSTDWNLEEATRRYNEAERQIRVLGQKMEEAQSQCDTDKKKIEYQLFDPAIATHQQITQVNALQETVVRDKAELTAANKRISDLESQSPKGATTTAALEVPAASVSETPLPAQPVDFVPAGPPPGTISKAEKPVVAQADVKPAKHVTSKDQNEIAALSKSLSDVTPAAGAPAPVQTAAIEVTPLPQTQSAPASHVGAATSSVDSRFMTSASLQSFLGSAVPLKDGVEQQSASGKAVAYKWQSGNLFGSAEQATEGSGRHAFDDHVASYLSKAKKRCDGTFAAKPGASEDANGIHASAYEIACVNDNGGEGASILFYGQNGMFTTVAHEGGIDDMDAAMDIRDKLMTKLLQVRLASN